MRKPYSIASVGILGANSGRNQSNGHICSTLSITCGLCKHHSMFEVANLILVVGEDSTVHDVLKKFRCKHCNVKGENNFQIVWTGGSDIALEGAGVKPATG